MGILLAALILVGLFLYLQIITNPRHLPSGDWSLYKKLFISREGRVIDTGNGNVTHSEGQGYGLLLAEAYGDRNTFSRIWKWTKENLQTRPNDKLLSWLWTPSADGGGQVTDPNNASDAEILVAWALVKASKRWGVYAYQQAAAEILADLRRLAVRETPKGLVLLPGVDGFIKPNGLVLNPSYYVFPALDSLSREFPGNNWDRLSTRGADLVSSARFGRWNLTPDWVLDGDELSLDTSQPPDFGYNAIRVPLHIAWQNPKSPLLAPFAAFWKQFPDLGKMPASVNLETNTFGPNPPLPGVQAIARFVLACESGTSLIVRDIPPLMSDEPYYSASLKMLTKLAISEKMGGAE